MDFSDNSENTDYVPFMSNYGERNMFKNYKTIVFKSCISDDPKLLKTFIQPLSRDYLKILLNSYYDDMTPLILSVFKKSTKVFNYLLDRRTFPEGIVDLEKIGSVVIDEKDENSRVEGAPALWIAAALNRQDMVLKLVDLGADIEHGSLSGSTPLRCASYDGHIDICRYLVSNGANLHAVNDCDQSPLMIGAAMGKENVVEYLLEVGAKIDQATSQGDTALHITVEVANENVVKLLLQAGAKNKPDYFGFTPLILSAAYRKVGNFKLLLDNCDVCVGELVDSYKILGAVFAIEENLNGVKNYWRRAECVRLKSGIPSPVLPVTPLYENVREPSTALELIQIDKQDTKFFRGSLSFHLMVMALCVFERLFGSNHPHTAHYLRVCGDFFLQSPIGVDYQRCMQFWLRAFEYEKIRFGFEINAALDLIISLDTFIDMFHNNFYPEIYPFVEWGVLELNNPYTRSTYLNNLLNVLSYFFSAWISACDQFEISHEERVSVDIKRMKELTRSVLDVKRNVPLSIMHASLHNINKLSHNISNNDISVYIPVENLELFAECGADVDVVHHKTGFSLLHTAIANTCHLTTIRTLINLGVYPFLANFIGKTAYDLMAEECKCGPEVTAYMNRLERIGKSLKTLSSLAVIKYDIDFSDIPKRVKEFVQLHIPRYDCIKV